MQLLSVDHQQNSSNFSVAAITDDDPLKSLALDYFNLFSNGSTAFSDVIFCVEGKQVHAHRCILAARSAFFRMVFCKGVDPGPAATNGLPAATDFGSLDVAHSSGQLPVQIPVGVVSYDVLVIVLQYLYSGQLLLTFQQGRSKCAERGCWHAHCSSHVDLALDTLHAATFFGVDQLSILIQKHLGSIVEKVSIDDVMRILMTAKKQGLHTLWSTCSELVARSGLATETLRKHLPQDIAAEIEEMRMQRAFSHRNDMTFYNNNSCGSPLSSVERGMISPAPAARIRKMRQALDSLDVELVRLMVMGEGLDLDGAHALHYSVGNCSRDVVKALLEMGAVNVNHPDNSGRTALHVACELGSPDMISVLLDHHASPLLRADVGDTPIDIIQGLIGALQSSSPLRHHDQNKLRLCLELLQSAAYVVDKEDDFSDGVVTEPSSDNTSCRSSMYLHHNHRPCIEIPDCSSSFESLNACNPAIATPISLHQDWASIESCSFEQDLLTSNLESKHHHHHQPVPDHHSSFIDLSPRRGTPILEDRGETSDIDKMGFIAAMNDSIREHAQLPSTASLSRGVTTSASGNGNGNLNACMISSNMDGFLYPEFRMLHTQGMSASSSGGPGHLNTTTIF